MAIRNTRVALFLTVRIFYLLDFNFYRIIFSFHICYLPYRESIAGSDFLIYEYASNNLYVIKSSYLHLTQILSIQRNYIMFYAITHQMPSEKHILLFVFFFMLRQDGKTAPWPVFFIDSINYGNVVDTVTNAVTGLIISYLPFNNLPDRR